MAIRIIEGKIGSGKSYFAVNHIAKNYYTWSPDTLSWLPKDFDGRIVEVYSNLDGFALGHNLTDEIETAGGLAKFFNVDFQKQFIGQRKIIYLIDEAQSPQFFHRKFYNPDVFFFFQYHRHLGCDIYLLTQDINSLVRELRELPEFVVRVVPRIKSLTGEFRYKFMLGEESYRTVTLKPSQSIFALYKSQNQKEVEKIGSATRRYAFYIALFVLGAFLIFKYGFLAIFLPDTVKNADARSVIDPVKIEKPLSQVISQKPPEKPFTSPDKPLETVQPISNPVLLEITITGKMSVSDSGVSLILFEDKEGREFKMFSFELDRLCKCSSFAKLQTGDVLEIEKPPIGTRFTRKDKNQPLPDTVIVQSP